MLTLTRKAGESIRIGDDISIVIKEIKGRQVRIGIVAPRDVYVCREELYLKIQEENRAAHQSLKDMGDWEKSGVIADPLATIGTLFRQRMSRQAEEPADVCSDVSTKIITTVPSTIGVEGSKLKGNSDHTSSRRLSLPKKEAEDEG